MASSIVAMEPRLVWSLSIAPRGYGRRRAREGHSGPYDRHRNRSWASIRSLGHLLWPTVMKAIDTISQVF